MLAEATNPLAHVRQVADVAQRLQLLILQMGVHDPLLLTLYPLEHVWQVVVEAQSMQLATVPLQLGEQVVLSADKVKRSAHLEHVVVLAQLTQ